MSRPVPSSSLRPRRLLVGGLVVAATLGVAASPAAANVQKTLTYACAFPYVGSQPISVVFDSNVPETWPSGTKTSTFIVNAAVTAPGNTSTILEAYGAVTIEGALNLDVSLEPTSGGGLPALVPVSIPKQSVPTTGPVVLSASGKVPVPVFGTGATLRAALVDDLTLQLVLRDENGAVVFDPSDIDDGDGDPALQTVSCELSPPGQDRNLLRTVVCLADEAGCPPFPTPTPTPVPTPTATPEPTPIPTPTATPEPTPVPSPTPVPEEELIPYSYGLSGSATLKTLTKGSLPLSGGIDAKLGLPSGNFTGALTLAPSTGNLTALGFLPVVAKVNLVPTDKVTGSLVDNKLTAVAKVRIKLPSVKTLGIELAGGANCQAKQISSITLASTQPKFLPLSGGPIAGSFDISDLSGCGFLTGIVSPLTKGNGNLIALNLTPKRIPAA